MTQAGQRLKIVVDDYIPTLNGKPAFAGYKSGQALWVMILEKALAKIYGSYERIEAG